jgi:hypothetical protein
LNKNSLLWPMTEPAQARATDLAADGAEALQRAVRNVAQAPAKGSKGYLQGLLGQVPKSIHVTCRMA